MILFTLVIILYLASRVYLLINNKCVLKHTLINFQETIGCTIYEYLKFGVPIVALSAFAYFSCKHIFIRNRVF